MSVIMQQPDIEMNSSESLPQTSISPYFDPAIQETPVGVLSDDMRYILEQIIMFTMLPLNTLGVVTNTINIRVFLEQGVRNDSTNIGFLALSVFDLLSCLTLIPYALCYIVIYTNDRPQHYTCTAYGTLFLYAHILMQHSNAWTTIYLSLVRTACVIIPLKVKLLFTPNVSVKVVVFIFVFFTVNQILYAGFTTIKWIFLPEFNASIAYVADSQFSEAYLYYNSIFSNQFLSVAALVIVSMTTSLMARKLLQVKKWRQNNLRGSSNQDNPKNKMLASKDVELMKSVTTVTCIFLVCLLMSFIPATAITTLPGVSFTGINRNLFFVLYFVRFLFDSINSSINFFFYIRISSRYKTAFAASFPGCYRKEEGQK